MRGLAHRSHTHTVLIAIDLSIINTLVQWHLAVYPWCVYVCACVCSFCQYGHFKNSPFNAHSHSTHTLTFTQTANNTQSLIIHTHAHTYTEYGAHLTQQNNYLLNARRTNTHWRSRCDHGAATVRRISVCPCSCLARPTSTSHGRHDKGIQSREYNSWNFAEPDFVRECMIWGFWLICHYNLTPKKTDYSTSLFSFLYISPNMFRFQWEHLSTHIVRCVGATN